jgi:SAM-dependent methyltransferase
VTHDSAGIAAYYDNLSRFLDFSQAFGRGGGAAQGSIHRFLAADSGEALRENLGPERLDHLVFDAAVAAGLPATPRVLDAGCGLGGTIFFWRAQRGGSYDGLTLSPEQHRRATREAARRGVADTCRFHIRSYQAPIPQGANTPGSLAGPFDAVIAIESLAHSPDPVATIANLTAALAPGGLLLIVDDMPDEDRDHVLLAEFKRCWRCPVLADAAAYRAAVAAAGMTVVHAADWTHRLRPRPLPWLRVLMAAFGLACWLSPSRALRDGLEAMRGGFVLEALYRTGGMRYGFIVARKPAAAP